MRAAGPMPSQLACLPSIRLGLQSYSGGRCIEGRLGHPTLLHSAGRRTEAGGPGLAQGTLILQFLWGLRLKTQLAALLGSNHRWSRDGRGVLTFSIHRDGFSAPSCSDLRVSVP